MTQHSPGPWRWEGDNFEDEPQHCPHSTDWTDHGPDLLGPNDSVIILSHGYDASGLSVTSTNARLIAAAPDLLAACEAVETAHIRRTATGGLPYCDLCGRIQPEGPADYEDRHEYGCIMPQVHVAIAKARPQAH